MNIAFLWNFDRAKEIYPLWRDGLRAAIEEIGKTHEVDIYLGKDCEEVPDEYDAIIFWSDSNDPIFSKYQGYKAKKGLCLSTNPHNVDNLKGIDVVFCESTPVLEEARAKGLRAIKAFGTDTQFFKPADVRKDIENFYPATFSPWKKQGSISHLGESLVCVGTVQPDGQEELKKCIQRGVQIEQGYFPVSKIRDYYQRSHRVIIPAIHGSERTVLEAMACGLLPVVNADNYKTHSYIDEYRSSGISSPREFVVKNYSHIKYAQDILKGFA